ncbi:MAG: hypothetical protein QOE37_2342 [Microbacteriaceae bacterium]|jgi:hypothetical protein|nr:hypothetical protein [Microbacteriaceae bacterium]
MATKSEKGVTTVAGIKMNKNIHESGNPSWYDDVEVERVQPVVLTPLFT